MDPKTILPSEDQKIHEAVNIGSVFLALDSNFITPKSLLQWLSKVPYNQLNLIAYKALCTKMDPNEQYLDDSFHILTKRPEYFIIAIGYGIKSDLPDSNSGGNYNPISTYSYEIINGILQNSDEIKKLSALILGGVNNLCYVHSNLRLCLLSRVYPYLGVIAKDTLNKVLASTDWTQKLFYNHNLPKIIISRALELQQTAPIYYVHVAYKEYYNVAVKLYKEKLLYNLDKETLQTFNKLFPNIIDQRILNYNNLCSKIALMKNNLAGYLLGFPIQNLHPSDEQIHDTIKVLMELGIDNFVEQVKKYTREVYLPSLTFQTNNEVKISNDTDVLMEPIENYVPFDIVVFQTGEYVYRFTRVEFNKLLESKKNPWTNEPLPKEILLTMKLRNKIAEEINLPEPKTHLELLKSLQEGSLLNKGKGLKGFITNDNINIIIDTFMDTMIPMFSPFNITL